MSLFSSPKAVIWPKSNSVDIYIDRTDNNIISLDLNLWKPATTAQLQSLSLALAENKINTVTVLIPDDVIYTKSFIYDTEISAIEKSEVIGLAESFINFKINPDYLDCELVPASGKTIIKAHIYDQSKIVTLEENLKSLNLRSYTREAVSQSIVQIIGEKYPEEYFLIYPVGEQEYTLLLAKKNVVYLTAGLKGKELEVQKIINYSKLYFDKPITKLFLPSEDNLQIIATSDLDKTPYVQTALANEYKKPTNLPLPVLGILVSKGSQPAIINQSDTSSLTPSMDSKKNILPFIAVFVITAALASVIIWFVLNKNESATDSPIASDVTPTETITETIPTDIPTPTAAEVDKAIKIQVLNATEINGQAATLKEKLTGLGFTSIAVGNSPNKLTENQIRVKPALATSEAYFAQSLAGFFDATVTADLPASSAYDAVFYIGTDLGGRASTGTSPAVTSKATPSPTKSAAKVTTTATPTTKAGTVTPTKKPTATPTIE